MTLKNSKFHKNKHVLDDDVLKVGLWNQNKDIREPVNPDRPSSRVETGFENDSCYEREGGYDIDSMKNFRYIYICIFIYIYTYIYRHIFMYIYIYEYVYINIYT
jgi:hypothetical protein